ncbi:MAG: cytidylate kinase-like family protein [Oscillospiraceae bacterium]|nr:cytidylate kinase-like family protein [Oscillospiraceae bacterium]
MIITISREYGAGGHTIGKAVAKELGIDFYDRDIIKAAAAESGEELLEVERLEEEITRAGRILRMISPAAYIDQTDNIRAIEQRIILEMALKGPCVILGRCADDIMEKAGIPSLNVFLYASDIHRAVRVSEIIDSKDPSAIQKKMQRTDTARRAFYEQFTGKRWGDSHNYTLSLDAGTLGYDTCAKIICEAARSGDAFKG